MRVTLPDGRTTVVPLQVSPVPVTQAELAQAAAQRLRLGLPALSPSNSRPYDSAALPLRRVTQGPSVMDVRLPKEKVLNSASHPLIVPVERMSDTHLVVFDSEPFVEWVGGQPRIREPHLLQLIKTVQEREGFGVGRIRILVAPFDQTQTADVRQALAKKAHESPALRRMISQLEIVVVSPDEVTKTMKETPSSRLLTERAPQEWAKYSIDQNKILQLIPNLQGLVNLVRALWEVFYPTGISVIPAPKTLEELQNPRSYLLVGSQA